MSERIDYYPVRVSPNRPVWEVDYRIRTQAHLPTIRPPIEYRWRNAAQRKRPAGKPPEQKRTLMAAWRAPILEEALERAIAAEAIEKRGKKPRNMVRRPAAIVPCYVYPGFRSWDDYHRMMRLSEELNLGLHGLIGMREGEPRVLRPEEQRFLESVTEGGTAAAKTAIHRSIKPGEDVRIASGPFAGHEAKFSGMGRDYAEVLIQIFGQMRVVSVPVGAVERV
jgi:transcription antitermination factor NusG